MGKKPITKLQLDELLINADTILLPTLLEVKTGKVLLVNKFLQQSFNPLREAKL
jgi:hypothetical protein